jgi:hypothetical protein
VEAQLDDFDDVMDMVLQRWRAADIAKVDLAWEKIVPLLPDERADVWLDNLQRCVRTGANWSPAFPVVERPAASVATNGSWPKIEDGTTFRVISDTRWNLDTGEVVKTTYRPVTPARARREQRFADVKRLMSSGVRQKDIAVQLGISQATVSHWLRCGINPPRIEGGI